MNSVALVGRLTRDPNIRHTQGQESICIASFSVAVDRRYKKDGQQEADFPSCVAFGKTAEFIQKYFYKGMRIGITGRLQTGSYEKDGHKVYTTDVVVESAEFVESKRAQEERAGQQPPPAPDGDGWMTVPEDALEELPFA